MDNHLHLLLRIDPDVSQAWTPIKADITQDVQSIFDRMEMDAHRPLPRVTNLLTSHRFYGSFMSATRATLRSVAQKLGVNQLANTA